MSRNDFRDYSTLSAELSTKKSFKINVTSIGMEVALVHALEMLGDL
jgi:hypothetical protein